MLIASGSAGVCGRLVCGVSALQLTRVSALNKSSSNGMGGGVKLFVG